MTVKLLIEHHLEFLSLIGGCTGSSESTLVKMPHCWKSHVVAQMYLKIIACESSNYIMHLIFIDSRYFKFPGSFSEIQSVTLLRIGTDTTETHFNKRPITPGNSHD